jgi:hypothetical protein
MRQLYEYHPGIGFRFVPMLKARVPHEGGGYLVRTNETGFRCDRPFQRAKHAGTRRVLLFGDSFTAGEGVSNGQRYSDFCEKTVPGLEIYNFGLPATGPDQHYLIYQEYAKGIEHDLLVIAIFVENIRRVGSRYRYFLDESGQPTLYAKPYYSVERGTLRLHGVPPPRKPVDPSLLSDDDRAFVLQHSRYPRLKAMFERLRRHSAFDRVIVKSGLKERALRLLQYQPLPEYDDPRHPSWVVMDAILQAWIAESPRPVAVMPIPLHHYVAGLASASSYQQRLRKATESAGGSFFDPLPALLEYPIEQRKTFYFPHDGHLTRAGHEALGKILGAYVRQHMSSGRPA